MSKKSQARKDAARKAHETLRKRLAKEKREAVAAGKAPPPTPAEKAVATLRASKAAKETARKAREQIIRKDLGHGRHDVQSGAAEILPPASSPLTPRFGMPAAPSSETAMAAAFRRAGIDPARRELEKLARGLLEQNGNKIERMLVRFDTEIIKRRDLRQILLLDYLHQITGGGQRADEAHPANAAAGEAPGHVGAEAQARSAGGNSSYKREPVHHIRTDAMREAAKAAKASSLGVWTRKIGDRPLGELTWGELQTLRTDSIREAGKHVLEGIYRAADAILIAKILDYAQVTDMATKVRDVVPDKEIERMNRESAKEAPPVVELGRIAYEGTLTKQIEHRP